MKADFFRGILFTLAIELMAFTIFHHVNVRHPPELSMAEQSAYQLIVPMPISEALVKFVSDDDFTRSKDTVGFTNYHKDPCVIAFRASDWEIEVQPDLGYADWHRKPDTFGESFPHEWFHCLRGLWHPNWSEITINQILLEKIQQRDWPVLRDREDGQ